MTSDHMSRPELDFLTMCADDFTPVCAAFDSFLKSPPSFSEQKEGALHLLANLITSGLIRPGVWNADVAGLRHWTGSPEDMCRRVADRFEEMDARPGMDDPLWFDATEAGRALVLTMNGRRPDSSCGGGVR
jgi:hypothetical protein